MDLDRKVTDLETMTTDCSRNLVFALALERASAALLALSPPSSRQGKDQRSLLPDILDGFGTYLVGAQFLFSALLL